MYALHQIKISALAQYCSQISKRKGRNKEEKEGEEWRGKNPAEVEF